MTHGERVRNLVRDSYNRLGDRYSSWAGEIQSAGREDHVEYILRELPAGSYVLDLGCGDGSLLTARLSQQFHVVGIDISRGQLALARRTVPSARFICADITQLSIPPDLFDAVTSFYCLTHIPNTDLPHVLKAIARWLRPNGLFVASFGSQENAGAIEPDWLGVPMFFTGHAPAENCRLIVESGLAIERERLDVDMEVDTPVTFHWVVARKQVG